MSQGIEEARNVMEGVRSVRPEVLAHLLKSCLRVKAVRLCVQWAEEMNLGWAAAARQAAKSTGGRGRWTAPLKDGTALNLFVQEMPRLSVNLDVVYAPHATERGAGSFSNQCMGSLHPVAAS